MTTGRTSGSSRSARRRPAPASRSPRAPTTPAAAGRPVPGVRAMTPCEARSVASTGATTRCSGPARCTPCGVAPRSPSATGPVTWPGAPPVRLMRDMGLHGVRRAKSPRTTRSAPKGAVPGRPGEPAFRRFRAERAVGGGHRAPRGAVGSGGDERASGPACRGGPVEAGGSPIPGTGVRAGSGPDNDGTHQYCQMVRARLARRRGIRRGTSG